MAPVAWPTAKLLDYLLGEDHGTVYKKAGLKTLVSLHRSLGEAGQQLNADEVTIISAVLDLKDKSVGRIMTPMDDVYTLSLDDVLDEVTMDDILTQGYSRIPVHHPDNNSNFIGMLLVKMLITYDPEDAKPVRDFALATLPETRPDTSCLDIVNFFQEGKSHMVLVSEYPGDDHGAIGVVTLEDVIEELIGEEIVDESDVFIDVHKAIRRAMPAPTRRISRHLAAEPQGVQPPASDLFDIQEHDLLSPDDLHPVQTTDTLVGKSKAVSALRRHSSASNNAGETPRPKRAATDEIMEHLKHLGPSNPAQRPKATRYTTVKIKPGTEATTNSGGHVVDGVSTPVRRISESMTDYHGGIGEGILKSGGKGASDGVQALQQGYGAISSSPSDKRPQSATKGIQADLLSPDQAKFPNHVHDDSQHPQPKSKDSSSTINSLPESRPRSRSPYYHSKGPARSGSITENIVDTNGFRKVVLETTSSSESNEEEDNSGANKGHSNLDGGAKGSNATRAEASLKGASAEAEETTTSSSKKKKRRRRKRGNGTGETEPLLK